MTRIPSFPSVPSRLRATLLAAATFVVFLAGVVAAVVGVSPPAPEAQPVAVAGARPAVIGPESAPGAAAPGPPNTGGGAPDAIASPSAPAATVPPVPAAGLPKLPPMPALPVPPNLPSLPCPPTLAVDGRCAVPGWG